MKEFRGRQRGQSMTEYVVVCLAIALALGISMAAPDSPLRAFFAAISQGYARFTHAMSVVL